MYPDDLKYTAEHEWVRTTSEATVRVGITSYAAESLGDIVFVQLPEVGDTVDSGAPMGELESTKSVSDLFAPVSGTVAARNEDLDQNPELCNSDPYGDGWIVDIQMSDSDALDGLMTASDYEATITSG